MNWWNLGCWPLSIPSLCHSHGSHAFCSSLLAIVSPPLTGVTTMEHGMCCHLSSFQELPLFLGCTNIFILIRLPQIMIWTIKMKNRMWPIITMPNYCIRFFTSDTLLYTSRFLSDGEMKSVTHVEAEKEWVHDGRLDLISVYPSIQVILVVNSTQLNSCVWDSDLNGMEGQSSLRFFCSCIEVSSKKGSRNLIDDITVSRHRITSFSFDC